VRRESVRKKKDEKDGSKKKERGKLCQSAKG
jgi:hypothetical protein